MTDDVYRHARDDHESQRGDNGARAQPGHAADPVAARAAAAQIGAEADQQPGDDQDVDGDIYVIYRQDTDRWFYPIYNGWASSPNFRRICSGSSCSFQQRPDQVHQMDHPELWNEVAGRYYAGFSWLETPYVWTNNAPKNDRLDAMCDAAKSQGIVVFAIGFEAPTNGRDVLRSCASSFNHYFDVQGLEISDAFQSIAAAINNLKLIQ